MRAVFCIITLVIGGVRGAVFLENTERIEDSSEPINADFRREACTAMAAGLAPCLAADTPFSGLTSSEEATCCETVAAFEQAGCFCLQDMSGIESCAYRRRAAGLAVVYERCTWQAVSCQDKGQKVKPAIQRACTRGSFCQEHQEGVVEHDSVPLAPEHESFVGILAEQSGASHGKLILVRKWLQNKGTGESLELLSMQFADQAGLDDSADLQVNFAMRVDVGTVMTQHQLIAKETRALRIRSELRTHPVLYTSLGVALAAFVLLCLMRGAEPEREPSDRDFVVIAAREIESSGKQ